MEMSINFEQSQVMSVSLRNLNSEMAINKLYKSTQISRDESAMRFIRVRIIKEMCIVYEPITLNLTFGKEIVLPAASVSIKLLSRSVYVL